MLQLLNASIRHLSKGVLFKIGMIVSAILGVGCPAVYGRINAFLISMTNGTLGSNLADTTSLDYYFFTWVIFLEVLIAVFVSYHVGTEFSDGIIRNKILIHSSRRKIYLSGLLANIFFSWAFFSLYWISALCVGSFFCEPFQMFSTSEVMIYILCLYAILTGLTSLLYMVSVSLANRTWAVIICVTLVVVMLWLPIYQTGNLQWGEYFTEDFINGSMVFYTGEKCPFYIGGIRRALSEFLLDFLPGGAVMQFYSLSWLEVIHLIYLKPSILVLGAAFFTFIPGLTGASLFQRKEIR